MKKPIEVQKIKESVIGLIEKGKIPNLTMVAEHMGVTLARLYAYIRRNRLDPRDLGITIRKWSDMKTRIEKRNRKIIEAVRWLVDRGKKPSLVAVARHLRMSKQTLSYYFYKHGINPIELGLILRRKHVVIDENEVREVVRSLKEKGMPPNLGEVAKAMGLHGSGLSYFLRRQGIDAQKLGIALKYRCKSAIEVADKRTSAKEGARTKRIKKAVKILVKRGESPNMTAIAEQLGMTHGGFSMYLIRHGLKPQKLGIVWRSRRRRKWTEKKARVEK